MPKKKIYLILVFVAVVIAVNFLIKPFSQNSSESTQKPSSELTPITAITHGHGLAVDVADSNKVYIATHHGLLLLLKDKDLYQIGKSKDDYMGFSVHPANPKVFFSSGHPSTGGNIGFQRSEDGGLSWKKISSGVNGPVDFHAMSISSVNPELIFGWYQGNLQKSTNGGKDWQIVESSEFPIVALATDSKDEDILYAASPMGLMVSRDQGKEWTSLIDGFVSAVALNPADSNKLISFSQKYGLAKSANQGEAWEQVLENFNEETPLYIAYDRQRAETLYILTDKNSIYKSTDEGNTWRKVR